MSYYNNTKFTDKQQEFKSGAVRDTKEGKGRFDLIPPTPLKRLAGVYERGAVHYGDRNWEKGMPFSRLLDSAIRHINSYREGDRSEDHIIQAVFNLFALAHFEDYMPEMDDIPKYIKNDKLTENKKPKSK